MKIFDNIKQAVKACRQIAFGELWNVFRDKGVLIVFFAAGLLYPLVYGLVYLNETLREVPIAVVDNSHSATSRHFLRLLDATPDVVITHRTTSMEEAKRLFAESKIRGVVYIPASFSKDIAAHRQTHISAYASMASMLYYRAMYSAVNFTALEMGKQIQLEELESAGFTRHEAEIQTAPLLFEGVALYNTKGGYASFLVPCILLLVLQQTLVLGVGILAGTAREENLYRDLIPLQRARHGVLHIVVGKGAAYLLLYFFIAAYNLLLVPKIFDLPQLVDFWSLMAFTLPYLTACVFFAISLSVFCANREVIFLLYLFSSIPMLFLSGAMWPHSQLPGFWKMISYIFPSTFGIQGFLKLNSMNADLKQIRIEYLMLWLQTAIYFVTAVLVYRRQIEQSGKEILSKE
ncbi:MAG: ABC transporter permease [Prevotellaceae bacterium]|jgi:ABC-2 type transport system permease protein|nr:ABC transporter permease [Prevotellaceae bacterium]